MTEAKLSPFVNHNSIEFMPHKGEVLATDDGILAVSGKHLCGAFRVTIKLGQVKVENTDKQRTRIAIRYQPNFIYHLIDEVIITGKVVGKIALTGQMIESIHQWSRTFKSRESDELLGNTPQYHTFSTHSLPAFETTLTIPVPWSEEHPWPLHLGPDDLRVKVMLRDVFDVLQVRVYDPNSKNEKVSYVNHTNKAQSKHYKERVKYEPATIKYLTHFWESTDYIRSEMITNTDKRTFYSLHCYESPDTNNVTEVATLTITQALCPDLARFRGLMWRVVPLFTGSDKKNSKIVYDYNTAGNYSIDPFSSGEKIDPVSMTTININGTELKLSGTATRYSIDPSTKHPFQVGYHLYHPTINPFTDFTERGMSVSTLAITVEPNFGESHVSDGYVSGDEDEDNDEPIKVEADFPTPKPNAYRVVVYLICAQNIVITQDAVIIGNTPQNQTN